MATNVLVIETFGDAYARHLRDEFPQLSVHVAKSTATINVVLADMDILLAFGIAIDNTVLARASKLKWIQSLATGVDHFLKCDALRPDVILTSARGIHGPPMRETVAHLMLSVARQARGLAAQQSAHQWNRGEPWALLAGKTAVLVGVGISGIAIAQLLKAFGMRVVGASRTPRAVEGFDEIVPTATLIAAVGEADYLINVLPAATENINLIGAAVFDAMKPSAFFINVGRGETVDERALVTALQSKRIAGAGLDVFSREPLDASSPLWDIPNVVVTPHIAGYVAEYEALVMPIIADNMRSFLAGRTDAMRNVIPHH